MLSLFRNFGTIPVPLNRDDNYHIHPDKIEEEIKRGTSVFITSNPRNPTGQVITNPELGQIQTICRDKATLIMDEFYGGYNYTSGCDGTVVSAADNIENVDDDDVLIIDGLTKRFRLPGWRVAWIIGPKEFIKAIGSCGSYLDGGTSEYNRSTLSPSFCRCLIILQTCPFKRLQFPCLNPTGSRRR